MADDLQKWLGSLSGKLAAELEDGLEEIANDLADDIRDAAPQGETGNLKRSVSVTKGRRPLSYLVEAGGDLTTRYYDRSTGYRREITIGQGDNANVPRGNAAVSYDYALAVEYGTQKMQARPFFYSTARAKRADINRELEDLTARALRRI